MSVSRDHDDSHSTHQQAKRTPYIEPISVHGPSVIHGISSALHRIPSHPPKHDRLLEAISTAHAGHYDVSRWHYHLHPRVIKECARNPLPQSVGRFIHPTKAILTRVTLDSSQDIGEMTQTWTSRNHRKHRYVTSSPGTERQRRAMSFWNRLGNMRRLEYWNISWWVAQAFTWGSVVWCVNGFAAWLPFVHFRLAQTLIATGWTAFLGATIFEIGSIFGILEAWNRDDTTSFGWSVKSALHHQPGEVVLGRWGNLTNPDLPDESAMESVSHRLNEEENQSRGAVAMSEGTSAPTNNYTGERRQTIKDTVNKTSLEAANSSIQNNHNRNSSQMPSPLHRIPSKKHTILQMENLHEKHNPRRWVWLSADPHYFYELGFLAAFFQLAAATIFWISGFTAIPAIQETLMKHTSAWKGAFWVPQIVGGSGFIISSTFIMLESQDVWYKPKLLSLGWHVGFWNFIGGIGFTACGALGYFSLTSTGVAYQSALCTFWGSWAFLIGSVVQWYESVNAVETN